MSAPDPVTIATLTDHLLAPVEESMSDAESTGTSIPFDNSGKKEDAEDVKEDEIKDEMNGDDDDDQGDDEDL